MAKQNQVTQAKGFPKKWIALGVIVLIILIFVATIWGSYNNLVSLSQGADNAWANVETQYQRRVDLIPNLVNVAQNYAQFEKSTLTQVTALRTQWMSQQGNPEAQTQTANQIEQALGKIILTYENYPTLTAGTQFTSLMDNLAETENMVMVARTRYNAAIQAYNTATMVFPSNVIAGWFGFQKRTYFNETTPGAQNAPVVNITIS